jgi:hypothetical protein
LRQIRGNKRVFEKELTEGRNLVTSACALPEAPGIISCSCEPKALRGLGCKEGENNVALIDRPVSGDLRRAGH